MELLLRRLYSESAPAAGITTAQADQVGASTPYKIRPDVQRPIFQEIALRDASFYESLAKAGFMFNFGEDGSGLLMMNLRRASGYCIDVGASKLVNDRRIKLKSGV
jgi:putative flavoprotein involved in K+ transport